MERGHGLAVPKKGRPPKKHVAVDSSGLEERRRSAYYLFRLRRRVRRKEFRKLHVASECRQPEKPIYSWELTSALKGDSPRLVPLLERIHGALGDVAGDKAYASRDNAQYVADLGGRPFLMPKRNATAKGEGASWLAADGAAPPQASDVVRAAVPQAVERRGGELLLQEDVGGAPAKPEAMEPAAGGGLEGGRLQPPPPPPIPDQKRRWLIVGRSP